MERRVTALLFALVLGLVAWMFFREQPKPAFDPPRTSSRSSDEAQRPSASASASQTSTVSQLGAFKRRVFDLDFGTVGEAGAMRITFDNHGAGIARVLLKDQFIR